MGFDMRITRSLRGYPKTDGSGLSKFAEYKVDKFGRSNSTTTATEVANWRNDSMILKWFTEYGDADCENCGMGAYVDIDVIAELCETCRIVLDSFNGKRLKLLEYIQNKAPDLQRSLKFNSKNLDEIYRKVNTMFVIPKSFDKIVENEFGSLYIPFRSNDDRVYFLLNAIKTVLMLDGVLAEHEELEKEVYVDYIFNYSM